MESLWPDNLTGNVERAPVHLLKEQAALLGEQTGNFVTGDVKRMSPEDDEFGFAFRIRSNILQYEYELFKVWHGVSLYPLEIYPDSEIMEQVKRDADIVLERGEDKQKQVIDSDTVVSEYDAFSRPKLVVYSEEAFKKALRLIFSSDKTRSIIKGIKSVADAYAD